MDKTSIKRFATWARRELIDRVAQKAVQYGITEDEIIDGNAVQVHGVVLTPAQIDQRRALIRLVQRDGFKEAMEEVAYTWFNRFIALRFMEVNDYLPGHTRAFTDENNAFKPKLLSGALDLELNGLNVEKVIALKEASDTEALYQYLLITLCNHLSDTLPGMFQRIDDYTELLFPEHLLREGSVIEQMVTTIPENDWKDAVQIVGWLYQYYNAEPKDQVFANLKKNIKISKADIPAATQLFTPDWIVRYMVENSLGRLWVERELLVFGFEFLANGQETTENQKPETKDHDSFELERQAKERELAESFGWKYYLPEAPQTPEVRAELTAKNQKLKTLDPTQILCVDPCCGSGHILVYMFEVLVQIYEAYGYPTRDAVASIVRNNLWGLDIDDRAAQLAYFAVMMKARQYDKGWFRRGIEPHIYAIQESNGITSAPLHDMGIDLSVEEYGKSVKQIMRLIEDFHDAKEFGSIIQPTEADWDLLRRFAVPRWESEGRQIPMNIHGEIEAAPRLQRLFDLGQALSQKYDVVVTNPPYMGSSGMGAKLSQYVKDYYPDSKSDLFAVFIERGFDLLKQNGLESMITMESWMFLSSFEKLRTKLLQEKTIIDLVHMPYLGKGGTSLGINFGTDMAVIQNARVDDYVGTYDRIAYYETDDDGIPFDFPVRNEYYKQTKQDNFAKIPGAPVAYWWPNYSVFEFQTISVLYESAGRNKTHNNELYIRNWWEISDRIRWQPYSNGGAFRRWAGNDFDLVDWSKEAKENYASHGGLYNQKYCGKRGICWNLITSYKNGFRVKPESHHYSSGAPTIIASGKEHDIAILAFLNSVVATDLLQMMNPTLNTTVGDVLGLPYAQQREEEITPIASKCICVSQQDWDSFETSWDFQVHPLLPVVSDQCSVVSDQCSVSSTTSTTPLSTVHCPLSTIHCPLSTCYARWHQQCEQRFRQLKSNEEALNRIFIDIYGLQDELTPEVEDKDVTVRRADLGRDIRSLISYAVGCMMGRYSLDIPGLAYAGGDWDVSKYQTFQPDKDGIIPITDDEYFQDDIVNRFVVFIETVYGNEMLEENLKYIARALYPSGSGTARELIRQYFLNDFYKDHLKVYQKRPIYWLFDAGKKNSFKCLIYMHRWQRDTVARVRTDYVHEMQSRYRTAIEDLSRRVDRAAGSERVKLQKQLARTQEQSQELRKYEEKVHHLADQMIGIDLDDGVKHNYTIFQDILAPLK
ncbi:MAG: BREX-1 system adenine-specific DNA-methyltransferase PglX [Clostridia bacterium]|nr:BREX-1 system adenine-specific DNA-methyltransferase PglX [Clostridia bacterium]